MKHLLIFSIFFSMLFLFTASGFAQTPAQTTAQANAAITTSDPDIPLDELEVVLTPMTSDELLIEADGWLALLKNTASKIAKVQLEIKQKNRLIEKKEEIVKTSTSESVEEKTEKAIETVTGSGTLTPDLGGNAGTTEFTDQVIARLSV